MPPSESVKNADIAANATQKIGLTGALADKAPGTCEYASLEALSERAAAPLPSSCFIMVLSFSLDH